MDGMDKMDEGRRTKDEHGRMDGMDDMDKNGRTRTNTEERIRERIRQLEMERDQFALLAPVRAEERMQALHAQLQAEITMRMEQFDAQINMLQELLAEPAKESD